jgi:hypothetical protein
MTERQSDAEQLFQQAQAMAATGASATHIVELIRAFAAAPPTAKQSIEPPDMCESGWTPEQALRFYAAGKHFDVVDNLTRILDNGAVASDALKGMSAQYAAGKGLPLNDSEGIDWKAKYEEAMDDLKDAIEDRDKYERIARTAQSESERIAAPLEEWAEQVRLTILGIDAQAERLTRREQTTFRDGDDQAPRDEDYEEIITGYKLNTGLWHRLLGLLAQCPAKEGPLSEKPPQPVRAGGGETLARYRDAVEEALQRESAGYSDWLAAETVVSEAAEPILAALRANGGSNDLHFDRNYPEDVFTPLTNRELEQIRTALFSTPVQFALDRLHAAWARHLAKVARGEPIPGGYTSQEGK